MINTAQPDIPLVHDKVAAAIAKAEGRAPATTAPETAEAARETETPASEEPATTQQPPATTATPKPPQSVTGGSLGSLSEGYAANQSEDLGAVC
jgi:hypothetical protein